MSGHVLVIDGRAVPQPRPRASVSMRGRKPMVHIVSNHGKVKDWKKHLIRLMKQHSPEAPFGRLPLQMTCVFEFKRPDGQIGKRGQRLSGFRAIPYANNHDTDNLVKPILDAATEANWWSDDGIVCDLTIGKYWSHYDRVTIEVVERPEMAFCMDFDELTLQT